MSRIRIQNLFNQFMLQPSTQDFLSDVLISIRNKTFEEKFARNTNKIGGGVPPSPSSTPRAVGHPYYRAAQSPTMLPRSPHRQGDGAPLVDGFHCEADGNHDDGNTKLHIREMGRNFDVPDVTPVRNEQEKNTHTHTLSECLLGVSPRGLFSLTGQNRKTTHTHTHTHTHTRIYITNITFTSIWFAFR
eukprot:GHVR01132302.1.p1 GENE.GHVR01132302.1~~GHVR01132302.1.p1  ORF type:complete len:188 (+),score=71.99 GHVR01132302.1:80-643(+)